VPVSLDEKVTALRRELSESTSLIIAYSGGVDSTCLLAIAVQELGDAALGVIADSPSLPREALREALAVAHAMGARVEVVKTTEFDQADYLANPPNRCYFCKAELFRQLENLAQRRKVKAIAYGENADDVAATRPGSRAAAEFRILAPLRSAGLTKNDVRELSRRLNLPTADAPAQPCLSSRVPHGTPVTVAALHLVERGEAVLRDLGFRVFRVRFVPGAVPSALIQVAHEEMSRLPGCLKVIRQALQGLGFATVEVDPNGYRAG